MKTTRRAFILSAAATVAWPTLGRNQLFAVQSDIDPVMIVEFAPDGSSSGPVSVPPVVKTDAEWRRQLPPHSFEVTRNNATESPFTGATWNNHAHGIYRCICCNLALFNSDAKFDSMSGWPSFSQPIAVENVRESPDGNRTKVNCTLCYAHLGHVFKDGPRPTGLRYCMNSAAMHFVRLT